MPHQAYSEWSRGSILLNATDFSFPAIVHMVESIRFAMRQGWIKMSTSNILFLTGGDFSTSISFGMMRI